LRCIDSGIGVGAFGLIIYPISFPDFASVVIFGKLPSHSKSNTNLHQENIKNLKNKILGLFRQIEGEIN
jgi:hypothetical protein